MGGSFRLAGWLVEPSLNLISLNGASIRLEPKVMEVLVCLAGHPGETVPKETLLETLWPGTFVTDDALKHSISELRHALKDDARAPHVIQTIPKRGYRLVAPVEPIHKPTTPDTLALPENAAAKNRLGRSARTRSLFIAAALLVASIFVVGGIRGLRRTSTTPGVRSLAVLPLQNLSGDPEQEFFSEGLTDALITDLAQIGNVKVVSRTSSARYKGTTKSLPEIASELGVDAIVEGTVQHFTDRIRITVQLIESASDKHLWASSYERNEHDIFTLERELTEDVVAQVVARLNSAGNSIPAHLRSAEPKALDAYLQACYHLQRFDIGLDDAEKREAQRYLDEAIQADPNFAPSYVKLVRAHQVQWPEPGDLQAILAAAQKAVSLDLTSADAEVSLGDALWAEGSWVGAQKAFRRAIALEPNNASAHTALSNVLLVLGLTNDAWNEAKTAKELNPDGECLSWVLYARGDYDGAIQSLSRFAESHPNNAATAWALSENYLQKGMYQQWIQELSKAMARNHLPHLSDDLQRALIAAGPKGAIMQWARELQTLNDRRQVYFPGAIAKAYAMVNDSDRAFDWLEDAYQHRDRAYNDPYLWGGIRIDPGFAYLRSDPRFNALLRRVGLPEV